ncbi:UDP-N-acetylglucosamine 4,6-dehydratase (inverting) [Akkermansiaceae bacterium]|nr:UDP-N-acetylglucosamine 4,6-dehydratase (inverting) [Akkermansiaceae bacterium]MDB4283768.1 UDP-N-acetylglucosamine 4,6-dehydratase (inverting) [Akkermansiaceae bacterium]MDB4286604.1 UDP-N-acetylglucosamine 4,6-dehydratase (inverting) [bacterium]MDC0265197.1 UDP-N-acetylglucosamine 4,6-dehydratase (inverting) [bacterium]
MKSILITGGTGSFGKRFVSRILNDYPEVERIVIYSRDELKQFEMAQTFSQEEFPQLRYFIGDVRDKDRLQRALEGIDTIIHAAALKQVPTAEYNPFECIKTNVMGAQNLIEAALDSDVKRVVALSTDKAAAPVNLYGATKLCSDKLFIAATNMIGARDLTFSVVRYGNVMGSRGSVIPFFMNKRDSGTLPITDTSMTRFNISLDEGVDMVFYAAEHAIGGEIFVPKIPSYRITDVATAIAPSAKQEIVGIRPGEKIHEEMITASDSPNTIEADRYYVIVPNLMGHSYDDTMERYKNNYSAKSVPANFCYSSGDNTDWLDAEQMRELIVKHCDPNFVPT